MKMGKLFNAFRGFLTLVLNLLIIFMWYICLFPPKPNDLFPALSTILGVLLAIVTFAVSWINKIVYEEIIKD